MLAISFLLTLTPGCSRPRAADDGVRVEMNVTPQPPKVGTAQIAVRLLGCDGQPLEAASVRLEGNMSHAGMQPTFATATLDPQGRWLAGLRLTMSGDWFVIVQAELEDGRKIERTIQLPGVESQ